MFAMNPDMFIGVLWMILTTICFSLTLTVVRYIGTDMPATQAAFIRFFFGAIMLAPFWLPVMRRLLMDKKNQTSEAVKTESKSLKFFILSGAIHNIAAILWFYATIHVLIANVTAIGYSIPLYFTIGAALFFGGNLIQYHLLALGIGFTEAM